MEGACKSEERGPRRCRRGSQGTWEMHSSRCQSPHHRAHRWSCRAPTGPTAATDGPREPSPASWAPPSAFPRYHFIGRFDGLSPPSRATAMIEWWKNSTGKADGSGRKRGRRRPVSDRQQRERRRTSLESDVATVLRVRPLSLCSIEPRMKTIADDGNVSRVSEFRLARVRGGGDDGNSWRRA